MKESSISVQ